MSGDEKVRENKVRRMADRQGLRVAKSRRRDPRAIGFGGFSLIQPSTNTVVLGGSPFEYSASLEDLEAYLTGKPSADGMG